MRHFGAMPTRTAQPLGRIDSLSQLGPFSKNDIYYCSSKVVAIAQRWANSNVGAHLQSIRRAADSIVNSSDPINATMWVFIFDYMKAADSGMFGTLSDARKATPEELECMKAIYWYEQKFLSQSGSGVVWNKANQIYVSVNGENVNSENVNSENVNLENIANGENEEEPFYKQTWFVALGSVVGVSLVGYIGYTIINK